MANANTKTRDFGDFQSTTLKTRVVHMEIKDIKGTETLILKLAHRLGSESEIRLVIFNTNGLMTAYTNGNLVVGQDLTVTGAIRSIKSHYTNAEGEMVALKHPEVIFNVRDFDFGAKPKAYDDAQITANPIPIGEESTDEAMTPVVRKAQAVVRRTVQTQATTSAKVQQRFGRIAEIQEAMGEVLDPEEALAV